MLSLVCKSKCREDLRLPVVIGVVGQIRGAEAPRRNVLAKKFAMARARALPEKEDHPESVRGWPHRVRARRGESSIGQALDGCATSALYGLK